MSSILAALHTDCQHFRLTLGTAESCTGGLLSALLTRTAGSSTYFLGGVCSYSNEAKTTMLGVPADLIRSRGAVSSEVAEAMVRGALDRLGSDYAIAVTGIAGPGGGTSEKPVGTVYCAWGSKDGVDIERLQLQGDRDSIRAQTCLIALAGLQKRIRTTFVKEVP